jgi:hypothetical protein
MAMNTWLQMVSADELAALRQNPPGINKLDKPAAESCSTYFGCTINYFINGDAYPSGDEDQPLTGCLAGFESVACETLENGHFHVVPPALAGPIAAALARLDLVAVKQRVDAADAEELAEEDVDDFEILTDGDEEDPGETLVGDIEHLLAFYKSAATKQRGVVIYTS